LPTTGAGGGGEHLIVCYQEAARLAGAPLPSFVPPATGAAPPDRGGSDKRISNARMLAELEIKQAYRTYRDGLLHSSTEYG
jgi:hypothetical protein